MKYICIKLLMLAILVLCLFINFSDCKKGLSAHSRLLNKIIRLICVIGLLFICLLPIIIFVNTNYIKLSGPLYFDNHWGTDRGFLWQSAVKIFSSGTIGQILFGRGPGGFCNAYLDKYYDLSLELGLYPNYDAHNVYLQFLCEYGLVGLISAMGFIALRIRKFLTSSDIFSKYRFVSLMGFLVASLFIVFQSVTLGWLPLLL